MTIGCCSRASPASDRPRRAVLKRLPSLSSPVFKAFNICRRWRWDRPCAFVGALTQEQVTIDFGTRAVNTNLQGVFPDGGNGGSFQLTGSGTGSFGSAGGLTAFNLAGGVTSARISDNAGNNCAGGCNLSGRTDQILVGQFARALGGSFHGNVPGFFSVNGTYLLEQSANLALQPTVSISSSGGSTN